MQKPGTDKYLGLVLLLSCATSICLPSLLPKILLPCNPMSKVLLAGLERQVTPASTFLWLPTSALRDPLEAKSE